MSEIDKNLFKGNKELSDKTKKTIDKLYLKILGRHADEIGLTTFGSLLENGKITEDEIVLKLEESAEYPRVRDPVGRKKVDELKDKTKKTIDKLYLKILGRHADKDGMEFFGTMLETGRATKNEIINDLLRSDERLTNQKNTML